MALEYETVHNNAIKALYQENDIQVQSIELEQIIMLEKLDKLQKQLDQQLEPFKKAKTEEHRVFDYVFGKNTHLKQDLPQKQAPPNMRPPPLEKDQPAKFAEYRAEQIWEELQRSAEPLIL